MRFHYPIVLATLLVAQCFEAALSEQCDPLRPNPPRNVSEEMIGKIDAKVDVLARRFVNVGGALDGTYKQISVDVLKDYPGADKLYLWDKTIYMFCIAIIQSKLSDREKADRIENLMRRLSEPPRDSSRMRKPDPRSSVSDLDQNRSGYGYGYTGVVPVDPEVRAAEENYKNFRPPNVIGGFGNAYGAPR
ncbi:MAG: hypothetical protein JSR61_22415 [Proteobacteria bacterium]|nr:hypothetical protein [Pseudomonadota bacterium]